MSDISNKLALIAVAGNDVVGVVIAALECRRATDEPEIASRFFRAVAAEAICFQDGLDVTSEVNLHLGRGRQLGNVHLGGQNALAADNHQETQADLPERRRIFWLAFQ